MLKNKYFKKFFVFLLVMCILPGTVYTAIAGVVDDPFDVKKENVYADGDNSVFLDMYPKIKQVSLNWWRTAALSEEGNLWMWGKGYSDFPKIVMTDVKQVCSGTNYSAVIKSDGTLWMWGDEDYSTIVCVGPNIENPQKVMDQVKQVSMGEDHCAILSEDGSLWMCGKNDHGQLGDGSTITKGEPEKIMDDVSYVELYDNFSAAIKNDGSLWIWGETEFSWDDDKINCNPEKIMNDVLQISLGNYECYVKLKDGGWHKLYKIDDGSWKIHSSFNNITDNVAQIDGGCIRKSFDFENDVAVIKSDGSLWVGDESNVNNNSNFNEKFEKILVDVIQVDMGPGFYAAIKKDGSLWMWGYNEHGQLGDGTKNIGYLPKQVIFKSSDEEREQCAVPKSNIPGGTYPKNQLIELTTSTDGAEIYYTMDGSTPDAENGIRYTGAIQLLENTTTLKAIAVKSGMDDSEVMTETYFCSSDSPDSDETDHISLNYNKITLKKKQSTTKVKVTNLPTGDKVKSWKSSNTKIVKVSSKGKITAQNKTGSATITVTTVNGATAKLKVKVQKGTVKTTKISGLTKTVTVKKSKKYTLKPVISPITSGQKVTYASSNKKIATVSGKGVITGKKKGKAKITVKSGSKKYVVTVTVK